MTKTLSCEDAVEIITETLFKTDARVGEIWSWGYAFDMIEPHRWSAGILHGYWLAIPEEVEEVEPKFAAALEALEALPIMDHITVKPYEIPGEAGFGGRLVGEKWFFYFKPSIVYTHRR